MVNKLPPEELFNSPEEYYSDKNLDQYAHSKSMIHIQEKITKRALEIIQAEPPALILDVGMGCGFSSSYLYLNNFEIVGLDLMFEMLNYYDIAELNPINADMRNIPLRDGIFDYIISISAFQWILNKHNKNTRIETLKTIAIKFNNLLKPNGKAVIQFYPLKLDFMKEIGAIFADYGHFQGNFIVDNPEGGPKRKIFLYLEK